MTAKKTDSPQALRAAIRALDERIAQKDSEISNLRYDYGRAIRERDDARLAGQEAVTRAGAETAKARQDAAAAGSAGDQYRALWVDVTAKLEAKIAEVAKLTARNGRA